MDNLKNLTMLFCNNCNLRSLYLKGLKKLEFFTYDDSVVLVRKHKNKSDCKIVYGVNG